jgi:hypothetical protein
MLVHSDISKLEFEIRRLISFFIGGLVVSGITAFPLEWEVSLLQNIFQPWRWNNAFAQWIELIYEGLRETNQNYPFIGYGTDWLGFAHLVIAVAFVGPWRDPVRNKWIIEFGIIACLSIFPFAFIAGSIRGIPIFWRIVDCSFGIIGGLLLWKCYQKVKTLEKYRAIWAQ